MINPTTPPGDNGERHDDELPQRATEAVFSAKGTGAIEGVVDSDSDVNCEWQ